jgi:hypothetical protein
MSIVTLLLASVLWQTGLPAARAAEEGAPLEIAGGTSTWISRHGSVLVLDRERDGVLQGYLINNSPGKGCRGLPYALHGRIIEQTITFQVTWRNGVEDCPRQTEWRAEIRSLKNGSFELRAEWEQFSTVIAIGLNHDEARRGKDLFTLHVSNEPPQSNGPEVSVIP